MQDEILNIHFNVRRLVLKALNTCRTRIEAAAVLGISPRTLHYKLVEFEIESENGIYISNKKIPLMIAA